MCGRYTLFTKYEDIINRFHIEAGITEDEYIQSYNIAPSQRVLSVINDGSVNRLGYLKWGLVPAWAKDEKIGYKLINARAESLTDKPSFRKAYQNRRCLIISDSFYEWKRNGDIKIPMRIKLKSDDLFAMAGLWEAWTSPQGTKLYTCTIITTGANGIVAPIHDRMPVILPKELESEWLNPAVHNAAELDRLLKPYDEQLMEAYEVSAAVNSPKQNNPDLLKRIG
ncbi:SOS response-associated peptidase [Bacillus sp. AGMB 02131]|uniref:Abasic site processing protein n=1 Tax=Peribacillus faecalis TaxID=2772559 RepID=A0A927CXX6_9BACI|nr:SOS response-associated peptidase [Peribacillus faecalis]MBD3109758.1 SOS response-associated peptidase [Peribacillus faecalis]